MYLLFDIGGTKMRIATSGDGVSLQEVKNFDSPEKFVDAVSIFLEYKSESYEKVVGSLAGVLSKDKSLLLRSPNLPNWVDIPIKNRLEELFETQVILENDAALAGLGEATYGVGREKDIIAYITISTGVGGARIVDKRIDAHTWGFEPGNQIIDADLTIWPESIKINSDDITQGSIESYVSGMALQNRFGKPASEVKDKEVWGEVEKLLAVCLNNVICFWSPEIVIFGGGLVLEDAVSLENITSKLEGIFKASPEIPEIKKAVLNDKSGLYGALSLVKNKEFSSN